jgi:hypothetical protein
MFYTFSVTHDLGAWEAPRRWRSCCRALGLEAQVALDRRSRSIPTSTHIPNVNRRLASDLGSTNCRCAAHLPFD